MEKHHIEITETISRVVAVETKTSMEALYLVNDKYLNGEIIVDNGDNNQVYVTSDCNIVKDYKGEAELITN